MEVMFRPARQEEAALLTELALRSKGHWGYDDAFLATCRDELTIEAGQCDGVHIIVAEQAGELVGYYQLAGHPPRGELSPTCSSTHPPSDVASAVPCCIMPSVTRAPSATNYSPSTQTRTPSPFTCTRAQLESGNSPAD